MAKRKSSRASAKTKKQAIRKASKAKRVSPARTAEKPSKGKWVYGFGDGRAEGFSSKYEPPELKAQLMLGVE